MTVRVGINLLEVGDKIGITSDVELDENQVQEVIKILIQKRALAKRNHVMKGHE